MPSPFVTAVARGSGGPDVTIGRLVGLKTFQSLGADITGVGFEDSTPSVGVSIGRRFGQVGNRQFYWHRGQVYRYDRVADTWVSEGLTFSPTINTAEQEASHSGLYFWQNLTTGDFGLMGSYVGSGATACAVKYDYITDTWTFHNSAIGVATLNAEHGNVVFRNQLFSHYAADAETISFDPVTNAFTSLTISTPSIGRHVPFIVANNQLFLWKGDGGGAFGKVLQLIGGAWIEIAQFINTPRFAAAYTANSRLCAFYSSADNTINFVFLFNATDTWVCESLNLTTLTLTDTSGQLPSFFTTASAIPGTYTNFRFYAIVDQEDVLGTPRTYIVFANGATSETFNIFEFINNATVWTDLGTSQLSNSMSIPENLQGGSTSIFTVGELWGLIRQVTPANNGVDVTLRLFGDPLKLRHGVVTSGPFVVGETVTGGSSGATAVVTRVFGTELECATLTGTFVGGETITGGTSTATAILALQHGTVTGGPFQVAETVTGGTSGATANVVSVNGSGADQWLEVDTIGGTPPFQVGETLTGGTSGATATLQSPPGLAADKFGRIRYDIGENPANTIAQLVAPLSGLVSPMTLNVNDFETTRFDGVTDYLVKHETVAQGIPNAAPISYMVEFERP